MTLIFARQALLPQGWRNNVTVTIEGGQITSIAEDQGFKSDVTVDSLLPALANLHSHTFQRAMAGMTEWRGTTSDSFWTWRDLMYRFVAHLTPEDVEAIAAFAFMEMQEQGFGACAEFHYLHHNVSGVPYDQISEMSQRIIAAADQSGIGLSLLPVLYTYGGLNREALTGGQLRFGNKLDDYSKLHSEASAVLNKSLPPDCNTGMAPHSLRAVSAEDLQRLSGMAGLSPVHIHVAEQNIEVDAVLALRGARPVEWLLSNVSIGSHWCLVHATHLTDKETAELAQSGAIAGLCPLTEANLGDGIFPGQSFVSKGGSFGVGTDSNIRISVSGELSMLEYSQRLAERQRNVLAQGHRSTGEFLYRGALKGGAQALGRNCGEIALGTWADLVAIDSNDVSLAGLKPDQLIDGWIFASGRNVVTDVWSAGRHCVMSGKHKRRKPIEMAYRKTLSRLAQQV